MIVSASRRTDIPALYGPWFLERVRAGRCLASNPFNPAQQRYVSLRPEDVDAVVFWTKNPAPFLPVLQSLEDRGLRSVFLVTLNDYPHVFEPGVPPLAERIAAFARLCAMLGPGRVRWRYDPIVLGTLTPPAHHLRAFERLCRELAGLTDRVIETSAYQLGKSQFPLPRPFSELIFACFCLIFVLIRCFRPLVEPKPGFRAQFSPQARARSTAFFRLKAMATRWNSPSTFSRPTYRAREKRYPLFIVPKARSTICRTPLITRLRAFS